MDEKKILIRIINQSSEVFVSATEAEANEFKKNLADFLRDPHSVVYQIGTTLEKIILLPKGYIDSSYIKYEAINDNNLEKINSIL